MNQNRRIFFICGDDDKPIGGYRKIYDFVDILNKKGFQAFIVHSRPGYRFTWFKNNTPIVYPSWNFQEKLGIWKQNIIRKVRWKWDIPRYPKGLELNYNGKRLPPINKNDVVVVSELMIPELLGKLENQPFVILNQGAYLTFRDAKLKDKPFKGDEKVFHPDPYLNPNLLGVITVSENNSNYLKAAYPGLPIFRVRLSIDPLLFEFDPDKKKQIVFMPRKCPQDIVQVISILLKRGNLKEWTFIPIDGMPQIEVAKILKKSAIFMSFSFQEGFALPPLEALFCGCQVVGYHGQAAKEYLLTPFTTPVDSGEIIDFVNEVEAIAKAFQKDSASLIKRSKEYADVLRGKYNQSNEDADMAAAWNSMLKLPLGTVPR